MLEERRIALEVLKQLQQCYPQFCARGDAGKWISVGLGQSKEPVYPPETLLEIVTDENCTLRRQIEGLEKKLQSKQKELEDCVDQLCDFDRKFEEIRYLVGAVAGHEVECLRNTLEARTNEVADLKKKLDVATKALVEVKNLNENMSQDE
jgi:predicted RNase H-like nuclease (RuvC/YqgF family)